MKTLLTLVIALWLAGCASTGRVVSPYWSCPTGGCNPNGAGWPVVPVESPPGGRMALTDTKGNRILVWRWIPIHLARCAEEHEQLQAAGWRHKRDTLLDVPDNSGVMVCSLDGFSLNVVQR